MNYRSNKIKIFSVVGFLGAICGTVAAESTKSSLTADLDPVSEAAPDASGDAKRETKTNSGRTKDTFDAEVKVPYETSAATGIVDPASAGASDVRLVLSRGEVPYSECALEFGSDEDDDDSDGAASFKVSLSLNSKNGKLKANYGNCDIDLATEGVQLGLPAILDGDSAAGVLVVDPADRGQDLHLVHGMFKGK